MQGSTLRYFGIFQSLCSVTMPLGIWIWLRLCGISWRTEHSAFGGSIASGRILESYGFFYYKHRWECRDGWGDCLYATGFINAALFLTFNVREVVDKEIPGMELSYPTIEMKSVYPNRHAGAERWQSDRSIVIIPQRIGVSMPTFLIKSHRNCGHPEEE